MWPWVIVGVLCILPGLLIFRLLRRTPRAAGFSPPPNGGSATEAVDSLLEQLEDAADLIIARLEAKQNEVEATIRLLDAKLEALQMALQSQFVRDEGPTVSSSSQKKDDVGEDLLARHELVRTLAEAGVDAMTIAQRTGLRLDEVRLIISLCGRRLEPPRQQ